MSDIDYEGIRNNYYTYASKKMIKINGNLYYIQCPKNIDSNTVFYVAGRGAGGIGDVNYTFKAAYGKNVIVLAPVNIGYDDFTNSVDVIDKLAKHFNISQPQASISGHSASGTHAMVAAVEYVKKYDTPTCVILNDPANNGKDSIIDYSALKDSFILTYGPKSGGCTNGYMTKLKKAAAAGAKVIICRYNNDHGAADEVAAGMGTYDMDNLILVDSNQFVKSDGRTYNGVYTYQWLDADGKLHDFKNAAEAQEYMEEALMEITGSLYEKCDNLADFAARYKGQNGTLASSLSYVSNSMSSIKSQITEHTDINYSPVQGEASVVGTMYKASNYYGSVTKVLYGNLSAEADAVYAIANAIYKLDGCAAEIAGKELTDGMKALYNNPAVTEALNDLNSKTAQLLDTAKNSINSNGRYDELNSILGKQNESGNVGKISITSLEGAINAIVPNLENEVNKATSLKAGVDDFISGIGNSNILQGPTWDSVKANMESYQNLLDCNVKAANYISDTIKAAMGVIVDYINNASNTINALSGTDYGSYVTIGELDDSQLEKIKTSINDLTTTIANQESLIADLETKVDVMGTCTNENNEPYECVVGQRTKGTESEIQSAKEALEKYKKLKENLETYAGILSGFAEVVNKSQQMISDAIDKVKNMYENPVKDTNGNQRFVADFQLDLSPYNFDKDANYYKTLINDYYAKLNPPAPEEVAPDDKNSGTPDGKTPGNGDDDYGYNPGGGGGGGSPRKEETTEEATTGAEEATEAPTEKPTETPTTEPITEEPSKVPTEVPTSEPLTELPTEKPGIDTKPPQKGSETKPPKPGVETKTDVPAEMPSEEFSSEEFPSEEFPSEEYPSEEYIEPIYEDPTEMVTVPIIDTEPVSKGNGLKTLGITAGVGVALGAAALGAHAIIKNKEENDEDSDYGYEK